MAGEKISFKLAITLSKVQRRLRKRGKKGNRYLDPPRVRVMYAPVG